MEVIGYLHIYFETMSATNSTQDIQCHISLGQVAKTQTSKKKSDSQWNEVFMFEVPKQPARLLFIGYEADHKLGECRYDVEPFFAHPGMAHIIQSDLYSDDNLPIAKIKVKVTYYSAQFGKLKIRIFNLEMTPLFIEKFKQAKIKAIIGLHGQTTPKIPLNAQWDQTLEILILQPTLNLTFNLLHQEGILATYTIYNLQKSGLMINQTKAYQVSLFNNEKAVGNIKYQIDWIKHK